MPDTDTTPSLNRYQWLDQEGRLHHGVVTKGGYTDNSVVCLEDETHLTWWVPATGWPRVMPPQQTGAKSSLRLADSFGCPLCGDSAYATSGDQDGPRTWQCNDVHDGVYRNGQAVVQDEAFWRRKAEETAADFVREAEHLQDRISDLEVTKDRQIREIVGKHAEERIELQRYGTEQYERAAAAEHREMLESQHAVRWQKENRDLRRRIEQSEAEHRQRPMERDDIDWEAVAGLCKAGIHPDQLEAAYRGAQALSRSLDRSLLDAVDVVATVNAHLGLSRQ